MNTPEEFEKLKKRVSGLEERVEHLEERLREKSGTGSDSASPAQRLATTPPPLPKKQPSAIFPPLADRPASPPSAPPPPSTVPPSPAAPPAAAAFTPASDARAPARAAAILTERKDPVGDREEEAADWRDTLRKLSLWPPEDGENTEARAGAWWATRIGAALLVIGVVFFGVYVAQGVSPLVRFLQLAAVAAGLTAAGHWLELKVPRFGRVVFGSGLALVFFTAFAAHAVPAVRVLENTAPAIGAQVLALLLIGGAAWWKNRAGLAAMMVLFGYISCFFSFAAQMHNISLVAAFLLAAAAAAFRLLKGWISPAACAVPGGALIYGVILHFAWPGDPPTGVVAAWFFPAAMVVMFYLAERFNFAAERETDPRPRRWLLLSNAAFATGLGLWATVRYFPEAVAGFYFLFAALNLAFTLAARHGSREDELAPVWFTAAMGLLALGLIELLDARTRWVALAVQSLVILQTVRRTRAFSSEGVMVLLWAGAGLLFLYDTTAAGFFSEPAGPATLWGAATAAFLALAGALACLQARWLVNLPTRPAWAAPEEQPPEEIQSDRRQLNFGYALGLGLFAAAAAHAAFSAAWVTVGSFAVAGLLGGVAVLCRHPLAAWAAAAPFLYGLFRFWIAPHPLDPAWAVWINGLLAIAASGAAAIFLCREAARGGLPNDLNRTVPWAGHALWLLSLQALLFKTCSLEANLLISALAALGLWAGSRKLPALSPALVPAPVLLAWAGIGLTRVDNLPYLAAAENGPLLFAAALATLAAVVLRDSRFGSGPEQTKVSANIDWSSLVGLATVIFTGLFTLIREFDHPVLQAALGLAGAGLLILYKKPGWPVAPVAAVVFLLAGHLAFVDTLVEGIIEGIGWTLLLAALTLVHAVLAGRQTPGGPPPPAPSLSWFLGTVATATLFLLFYTRGDGFAPYVTVFWGASAGAVFLAGLAGGAKPVRLIGLAGLALCLPRAFLVDIHSTLHRIAAFLVIGVVLLIIGYLYHRFRNRIGETAPAGETPPE